MTLQQIKDNAPDFDLEKMREQLKSGVNELPNYKTTEELHQWIKLKKSDYKSNKN